jgi:hypothetical protein
VAERKGQVDARMQEYRWMLEELRVSFFAQELRTPYPVSAKRLDKVWRSCSTDAPSAARLRRSPMRSPMLWRRLLPAEQGFVLQHFGAHRGPGWQQVRLGLRRVEIRGGRCA